MADAPKPRPTLPPAPAPEQAKPAEPSSGGGDADVVVLGPPTADGGGVHVLRARKERLEAGELRHLEEGRPITGEIVTLAPRKDNPRVCDVKDSYAPRAGRSSPPPKGPAQVATQAYRDNWDEVFAQKRPEELN
jgi:hypothetical protein